MVLYLLQNSTFVQELQVKNRSIIPINPIHLTRLFLELILTLLLILEVSSNSTAKLSTFIGGLPNKGNASIVQMRRSTNKKGKQAPAPPKRTRYLFILLSHKI